MLYKECRINIKESILDRASATLLACSNIYIEFQYTEFQNQMTLILPTKYFVLGYSPSVQKGISMADDLPL